MHPLELLMRKPRPLWQVVIADLLLIALLLLVFAYIHHGGAYLKNMFAKRFGTAPRHMISLSHVPAGNPDISPIYTASTKQAPSKEETEAVVEPEEEIPDNRTEWQKKFADHFTDEIVTSDLHYSSPNISIDITPIVVGEGYSACRYYVADIYVGSLDCFRTYLADNLFELYRTQPIQEMAADSSALLAMTGDFYSYQYSGLMIRNGRLFRNDYTGADICVLYGDGTMKTLHPDEYSSKELVEEDIWQLWNFGPALLDENGQIPARYNVSETVSYINPRSSVGYYEPGHYCFIVVDGRLDNWSVGMTLPELSQVYFDLGCRAAYNLDGGGSAVMTFGEEVISRQSNGGDRELGDILLIAEPNTYDPNLFPMPEN